MFKSNFLYYLFPTIMCCLTLLPLLKLLPLNGKSSTLYLLKSRPISSAQTDIALDFPGGPVVKNPSANTGGTGLIWGPWKITHTTGS